MRNVIKYKDMTQLLLHIVPVYHEYFKTVAHDDPK